MKWLKWGLGLTGIIAAAGIIGVSVFAGGGSASAQTPPGGDNPRAAAAMRYETLLAQKLGISVDTLKGYQQSARDQVIDEALAAGKITPEQAATLKSKDVGELRGHLGKVRDRVRKGAAKIVDAAAKTIGISSDDVKSQLQSGKSLAQVASDHNVSRDQLKTGITTNVKLQLDEAVSNGTLTQAQADKLTQGLNAHLDQVIDRTGGHATAPAKH